MEEGNQPSIPKGVSLDSSQYKDNLKQNPICPHGPTLLYKRSQNNEITMYYACAGYRDRKKCNYYSLQGDHRGQDHENCWKQEAQKLLNKIDKDEAYTRYKNLMRKSPKERLYCHTCSCLDFIANSPDHNSHNVHKFLSDHQMKHPSEILIPEEHSKREAQYFFSKETITETVAFLKDLGALHLLCIGAPRIHEYVQNTFSGEMTSLLMDIDHRYLNFYGPLNFCWYNMFNHHFFSGETSRHTYENFLQQSKGEHVVIVYDPPFGSMISALGYIEQMLQRDWQKLNGMHEDRELPIFCASPYFMEPQFESFLGFTMLDYKINYDNQKEFQASNRKGSPVRFFTNVDISSIALPSDKYRLCQKCEKWVALENEHCDICGICPSKNGEQYKHCSQCGKCMKPRWIHCPTCKICHAPEHACKTGKRKHSEDSPRARKMRVVTQSTEIPLTMETKSKNDEPKQDVI